MRIERTIKADGSICEHITLNDREKSEIYQCHGILRLRFHEVGQEYTKEQQELCDWWLLRVLRFEGLEKMVSMAETAPFHRRKKLMASGYAEVMEVLV